MISLSTPDYKIPLTNEQLLLLQKACYRAGEDAKQMIYDLRVYYKTNDEPLIKLREEVETYQNLRIIFEDLENLNG